MKKTWRSNLDEQQEHTLLKIEHNGCWIAFWGLLAALIIELIAFGPDSRMAAGEWVVFMILCVYLAGACLKNGIWDRRFQPDIVSNLKASLLAGVIFGLITFVSIFRRYSDKPVGSAAGGIASFVMVFVLCFIVLQIMAVSYRKRRAKMDEEPEEE